MISEIAYFLWNSAPFMTALFTVIFLISIRIWTRATKSGKAKKCAKKIGDAVNTAINKTRKAAESFCDTNIDLNDADDTADTAIKNNDSTNYLDTLFFGEIFVASVASGIIISLGWAK